MKEYSTSQVAGRVGIHPNTVRMYEACELIPQAHRRDNGYRVFTDFHVEQLILARAALRVEVLQNGLRKQAVSVIKTSATGDFDTAVRLVEDYLHCLEEEKKNAKLAIATAEAILHEENDEGSLQSHDLLQRECAAYLGITIDTLRNWEKNGLLEVKRKENGYRVYTQEDLKRLIMIRSLRCANYSLSAILRMLNALSRDPYVNPAKELDTPREDEDVISACDRLLTSLSEAQENARFIHKRLLDFKRDFPSSDNAGSASAKETKM